MYAQLFWVLPIVFLIILFMFLRWARISLLQPNTLSIYIWFYIFFAYIGIIPLYYYWDKYRYLVEGVRDREIILQIWIFSSLSLFLVVISYVLLKKFFIKKGNLQYKTNLGGISTYSQIFMDILLILSVGVSMYYLISLNSIPLLSLFSDHEASNVKLARSKATNDFSGNLHWFKIFYNSILTFISYIYFSIILNKKTKSNIFKFILLFLITTFIMLSTTQKAPVIFYWMGLFLTYLISKNKKVSFKSAIIFVILVVPTIMLMYTFFMKSGEASFVEVLVSANSRIFTGQIVPAYFYLYLYPAFKDFLLGQSLPNPGGVLPWDYYPLPEEIKNFMNPELASTGIVGTAPTAYWAEMYANFGVGGIIISSILLGATLFLIQYLVITKMKFNAITIGLLVFLTLDYSKLALSGFSYYIFNMNRIVIIGLAAILIIFNYTKKRKVN